MPSPFPGMDPFIESQVWESFHSEFMNEVARSLSHSLPARYVVRAEQRVYLEHGGEESKIVADGIVLHAPERSGHESTATATMTLEAVDVRLDMPEERREIFLEVRLAESREVITVLELLSPANKRAGEGFREYRRKLDRLLPSGVHFVELDLLRGGRRCSTKRPSPGYQVLVSRERRRPSAEAYQWTWREPMPTIPVPLRSPDDDGLVDLQGIFETLYDERRYDGSLDYDRPLDPKVSDDDAEWIAEQLRDWRAA